MPLLCPRCQRANPGEAVFCHFDGVVLRQDYGAGRAAGLLPQEFVFPSGRRCRTFDELVQGCQYEWEDAREILRRGDFAPYLARLGRHDLARAAQEARAHPDPDIALHEFVASLPAVQAQGPRLDLRPRRIQVGPLPAGRQTEVRLTVVNQGKGILQGKLTVGDGARWLRIDDGDDPAHAALKTPREQHVTLRLDSRGLAAWQAYSGRLTVITNGGIAEVPVRLSVTAVPYPRPPFQGALSARELAEWMRADPRSAVPALESGEVARWFAANGWAYPVPGELAPGIAAVQQFFEHLGLSKPPPVELSAPAVELEFGPAGAAACQVTLRTPSRKWVYAHVDSDVPWLRVTTPAVSGPRQAVIAFEADPTLLDPGTHDGSVRVVANAGQKLALRVRARVAGAPPKAPKRPKPPRPRRRPLPPIVAGALLGLAFRLALAVPADLFARLLAPLLAGRGAPGGMEHWLRPALAEAGFLRLFVLATFWLGGVAGYVLVRRRGGSLADRLCGVVTGAATGLAASATAACLMDGVDTLPRLALAALVSSPGPGLPAPVAAVVWVAVASLGWGGLGAVAGLLAPLFGDAGRRALAAAAAPLAWLLRACRCGRAAELFAPPG
jgi:hypothetical protein